MNAKNKWLIMKIKYKLKIFEHLLIDDRKYISKRFYKDFGISPDLINPSRFTEKNHLSYAI